MKKLFLVLVLVVLVMVFSSYSILAADSIILRWGSVLAGTHPIAQMIDRVAKTVAEKTDGRIEIQNYPAGQLGSSRDQIESVSNGIQEMVTEGVANFGQFVPSISILEAPYIWRDLDHMLKVANGPIGQDLNNQLIGKSNMRILATIYYGVRQLTTTNKEVRTVADMKNFKLRVPETDVFLAMARAWGANPTPMTFTELYLALKQNVVDGQENPLPTIDSAKFYEVQKYLILTGHIMTPMIVVINEDIWKKISPADQKILQEAVQEGGKWNNEQILEQEKGLISKFKSAGVIVIEPNVEEFRKAVLDTVPQQFEEKWGKGVWEKIQNTK